jgi:hypothetical protein
LEAAKTPVIELAQNKAADLVIREVMKLRPSH